MPDRGDVIWITLDPVSGHEQAGRRPALVLSPAQYNGPSGRCLCCPITSRVRGRPFEALIPPGQPVEGVVLCDQVRSFDWRARQTQPWCRVPNAVLIETLDRLAPLLSFQGAD